MGFDKTGLRRTRGFELKTEGCEGNCARVSAAKLGEKLFASIVSQSAAFPAEPRPGFSHHRDVKAASVQLVPDTKPRGTSCLALQKPCPRRAQPTLFRCSCASSDFRRKKGLWRGSHGFEGACACNLESHGEREKNKELWQALCFAAEDSEHKSFI